MAFRMLLGRTAMHERIIVDPEASYLIKNSRLVVMKIGILSRNRSLYSTARLIEVPQEQRGHRINVIDTTALLHEYQPEKAKDPLQR